MATCIRKLLAYRVELDGSDVAMLEEIWCCSHGSSRGCLAINDRYEKQEMSNRGSAGKALVPGCLLCALWPEEYGASGGTLPPTRPVIAEALDAPVTDRVRHGEWHRSIPPDVHLGTNFLSCSSEPKCRM